MNLIENLQWRYATKRMNGNTVPQEKLDYILEAARLAPSSSGLQPYSIFVISNKELMEQIKPIAWDQQQITEASHLLVFASWDSYSEEKIDAVFKRTVAERGMAPDAMDAYKQRLWGMFQNLPTEWHAHHTAKQAYISFGMAIAAAAEQKVDATPMEGFDAGKLDELMGLNEKGLKSSLILTLGYRDESNDWLTNLKKVRTPKDDFIFQIN